jgi:hypothetical protein
VTFFYSLFHLIINPGVLGMLTLLSLGLLMLWRPRDDRAAKIAMLMICILLFGPISKAIMGAETAHTPLRFDYYLYLIDKHLGISGFLAARLFQECQRSVLYYVYQSLVLVMILWYAASLVIRTDRSNKLLIAYLADFLVGPCLYLFVPASGPRITFGAAFPAGNPDVSPVLVPLGGWPNAMPSLHLTTALIFVLFAGNNRVLRCIAWIYLGGTAAATLAFEHYLIDLIVAVPFACFATCVADRKIKVAMGYFALVLAWLLAIRFATPTLIAYPFELRILAVATVSLPILLSWTKIPGVLCGALGRSLPGQFNVPSSEMARGALDWEPVGRATGHDVGYSRRRATRSGADGRS